MKTVLHRSASRGYANHGWLESHHSFSFAEYRDPERMHFGALRVLNDDVIQGGKGFDMHPHDNMEIVSIALKGALKHNDSMGNNHIIKENDIQVMSAGTGLMHSEFNHHEQDKTQFLQIWVFPNKKGIAPRYDQIALNPSDRRNKLEQIVSPNPGDGGVWIQQDAWFHRTDMDENSELTYQFQKAENGLYVFVLEGDVTIMNQPLNKRDGFGIWETNNCTIHANTNAELLLMEVPMEL